MSLNDAVSKIDLEPTDDEIDIAACDSRFHMIREQYDDWRDILCMVENQLRRERGLIPA